MKHAQKHSRKISKDTIKKGITTLVLLFFAMVMILQKDSQNTQLQFVRTDTESFGTHNAPNDNTTPSQRDYLFQNEAGNDVYQGQITQGQRRITGTNTETMDNLINPDEVSQVIGNTQTGQLYT